jgi:hypothetical protein
MSIKNSPKLYLISKVHGNHLELYDTLLCRILLVATTTVELNHYDYAYVIKPSKNEPTENG